MPDQFERYAYRAGRLLAVGVGVAVTLGLTWSLSPGAWWWKLLVCLVYITTSLVVFIAIRNSKYSYGMKMLLSAVAPIPGVIVLAVAAAIILAL